MLNLDFVVDVLRVFSGGKDTQKLQVVKSVWESTRIQILQMSFELLYLGGFAESDFQQGIMDMDKHLQSLLIADESECKLTHFCFVNAIMRFLKIKSIN